MGNICRSPTAHGIFQNLLDEAKLSSQILVESSGTTGYHSGESPDHRACSTAIQAGVNLSSLRAQQITSKDYLEQAYILAMDCTNLSNLLCQCPDEYKEKIRLLLDYHPDKFLTEVPDPYYGGDKGFEKVFEMLQVACVELLTKIKQNHQL